MLLPCTNRHFFGNNKKSNLSDDPEIKEAHLDFDRAMDYARSDLVLKIGNYTEEPSRFSFFKRWFLERKLLNYNHQEKSMFLFAYRAFIAALAKHDKEVLKKMVEPKLYKSICENH